jgi:hypothetical protein
VVVRQVREILQVKVIAQIAGRQAGDHLRRQPVLPKLSDGHLAQGALGAAQRLQGPLQPRA